MHVELRRYRAEDLPGMAAVWNEIVEEGAAFPQEEPLTAETAGPFFAGQTDTVVAADADTGAVLGEVGRTALAESGLEPHLHLELLADGEPVNPLAYLPKLN